LHDHAEAFLKKEVVYNNRVCVAIDVVSFFNEILLYNFFKTMNLVRKKEIIQRTVMMVIVVMGIMMTVMLMMRLKMMTIVMLLIARSITAKVMVFLMVMVIMYMKVVAVMVAMIAMMVITWVMTVMVLMTAIAKMMVIMMGMAISVMVTTKVVTMAMLTITMFSMMMTMIIVVMIILVMVMVMVMMMMMMDDDDDSIDSDSDGEQSTEIPLYNDSPISSDEFRSIFLALQQKHNFSSAATNSILKLFQVSLPPGNKCPRSSYKFEAELSGLSYSYTKTFTCQQCQHVLDNSFCTNMDCSQYEDIGMGENSSVFYIIDLVEEIKVFIIGM
jgi:hypothetical protein